MKHVEPPRKAIRSRALVWVDGLDRSLDLLLGDGVAHLSQSIRGEFDRPLLQEVVAEIGVADTTQEEGLVEVCKGFPYSLHRVDYLGGKGVADFDECVLSLSHLDPSCQVAREDLRVDVPTDACCYPGLGQFVFLQLLQCGLHSCNFYR